MKRSDEPQQTLDSAVELARVDTADIAIIGMAGRFPGARSVDEFWRNLSAGVESITRFSREDLLASGVPRALIDDPNFVPAASSLADVELFDAAFFGYHPREAELMDPQHRILLECSREALENAGYDATRFDGVTAVYVGAAANTYLLFHLAGNPALENVDTMQVNLGNSEDFLATRISYKLNLNGPSLALRTACSTSLVAVHLACQSLLNEECDLALAGGVAVNLSQPYGYRHLPGGIVSPDGHCRTFDARAEGTVFGSGAGVVVLKRLSQAIADRDTITAVIKGSAINNDGSLKVGYTAPSLKGQAEVIAEAQAVAGIDPRTIGYVEAHGTGTAIGDPIEIEALTKAFRTHTSARSFCAIGSVKSNIGHLDAAAGIAGLIKAALALKHRSIPPSLHFETPNPQIDFARSPFYVNAALQEWTAASNPRRAAVSAFGIGGTNAHVILEEAPQIPSSGPALPLQLLLLSAKTAAALEAMSDRLAVHLRDHPEYSLPDIAYTLQQGRQAFQHRKAFLCRGREDAIRALEQRDSNPLWTSIVPEAVERDVAFLFPDEDVHYPGLARALYLDTQVFRHEIDRCSKLLRPHLDRDLRESLFEESASDAFAQWQNALARPALFVIEYALAQLLRSWKIRPNALAGSGVGEHVAACLAGVSKLEDTLELIASRARLNQPLPAGPSSHALQSIRQEDFQVVQEVGPSQINDESSLWQALARFWLAGVDIDWRQVHAHEHRRRVPLPAYPFERKRHWIHPPKTGSAAQHAAPAQPAGKTIETLKRMLSELSGIDASSLDPQVSFSKLGLDSLLLLQLSQAITDRFGLTLTLRQFFEELQTLAEIAEYIDRQAPQRSVDSSAPVPSKQETAATTAAELPAEAVQTVMQQLNAIAQQVALLQKSLSHAGSPSGNATLPTQPATVERSPLAEPSVTAGQLSPQPFVPYQRLNIETSPAFTARQQVHLEKLIERYTARTWHSKDVIDRYRAVLANNRSVAGFRLPFKEMVFQIAAREAAGSRFRDLDGNEYVDISMGFGVYLFGHQAPFIRQAVEEELRRGAPLGPFSRQAGEVAQLIHELTGVERVAFFNSGTEAVMVALRLARAVTGRSKIGIFAGSFHGTFDGILARANMASQDGSSLPLAPGIPQHMTDHVLVLNYGNQDALTTIARHAHELAAVLVEPVQSRRPDFQPGDFLTELRAVTQRGGIALIFDEVITGFRIGPGGAQAHFSVQADLVTYGKVIGGGMPIGVVAGRAEYMDGIDGGPWRFGDASYPPHDEKRTFVAGTFCQHPFAMAAAAAVLRHLREQGPILQRELNQRTAHLIETLDAYFADAGVPIRMARFGSLFRFVPRGDLELLFYHLIEKGVYIWEGRNCFLSTEHSAEDIQLVVRAVRESVEELREGGFLPEHTTAPAQHPAAPASPQLVPMTDEQKQLWTLTQIDPNASSAYNECIVLRLRGALRVDVMCQCLQTLFDRHEALRTTISADGETQQVRTFSPLEVPVLDFTANGQAAVIQDWLIAEGNRSFDLESGPLMRVCIIRSGPLDHLLVFVVHHIVADDWSRAVLLNELAELYSAASRDQASDLRQATPFRAFVAWQARRFEDSRSTTGRDFWLRLFAASPPSLELPTDHPRGPRSYSGERRTVTVDNALASQLKQLGAESNTTLFVMLLSAFIAFLHRISGQRDIVLGIPSTQQPRMGARDLVGQCITMLPFYSRIDAACSFARHLQSVKSRLFDALEYQDYSSVAPAAARQNKVHIPELTVMFNMDRAIALPEFAALRAELLPFPITHVKFDLSLNCVEIDSGIQLQFDYRTDLLEAARIEDWTHRFELLLRGIVDAPASSIGELPLLTPAERDEPEVFRQAGAPRQQPQLYDLFDRRSRENPQAVAIVDREATLTYEALRLRAEEFAACLNAHRMAPGHTVAIAVDNLSALLTCLLGSLKASCSYYIPRPGAFGPETLSRVGAATLAEHPSSLKHLTHSSQTACDPRSACVLFADGQTHSISHDEAVEHCRAIADLLSLARGERVLSMPVHFADGGLDSLLPALLSGATLVAGVNVPSDLRELQQAIAAHGANIVDLPLAHWRSLAATAVTDPAGDTGSAVRVLIRGAAPIATAHVRRWREAALSAAKLCFCYAPECRPIAITALDLSSIPAAQDSLRCPVGSPLLHAGFSIRDAQLNRVPPGVHGEICLDIPDSLFRTGVRGRRSTHGQVEVLGPPSELIWIRGRSVELGDVAASLLQHPLVQDAVVAHQPLDDSAESSLIAYYVPALHGREPGTPSVLLHDLRQFLRTRLPDYMLPSAFTAVEQLPLLDNGDVDRARLPKLRPEEISPGQPDHRTLTPAEQQLAGIWRQVLGLKQVGLHDNFFELGGHSMLATALAKEIRHTFALGVTLRDLFEAPTIEQMAALLGRLRGAADPQLPTASDELPQIEPQPEAAGRPFALTDVQQAYWVGRSGAFGLGNVSTHTYYEVDSLDLDLDRFERAWQALIDRHPMLRTIVLPTGQQQVITCPPAYRIARLDLQDYDQQSARKELEQIRDCMSHQVLPSDRWPLFDIRASRLPDQRLRIHISIDALIVDAWSMQILFRELSALYSDLSVHLAPLPLSFRDYVLGEGRIAETALYQRSKEYWDRRLQTLPPAPDLPLARDLASLDQPRFVRWAGRLAPGVWRQLKARAVRANITPSIVLIAAYAEVLGLWSKNQQFTLNLTLFNRLPLHPQVNDIIGDFTSVTLLSIDNSKGDTFEDRARHIQQQFWEDLDHRYYSGVRVLRDLARARQVTNGVIMPVVFTSSLIHDAGDLETSPMSWLGDVVFAITQTPQVWLDHEVYEDAGSLVFTWDVVADLFPPGLVDAIFEAFSSLLHRLAAEEQCWSGTWLPFRRQLIPAADLPLSAAATPEIAAPNALLHTLVADQASARPQQPAILTPSRVITYEEMAGRANQIGRRLRDFGATPNTLVAIVMSKGWEQVVAALGVLNSGAAYLPIDAALPRDRVLSLLEQGQVSLALTQTWFDNQFSWPHDVYRFRVDSDDFADAGAAPLEPLQSPGDLAYVIFTSGSTGAPKGVMIDHRGAANTVLDVNQRYRVGPDDRVLALSSLSFDLSVYDVFGMLAAGAAIVIPDPWSTRDPAHWTEMITRHQVTIWNSVPQLMEMLIEYVGDKPGALAPSLRLVLMSGDWIPVNLPARIRALLPDVRLVSLGGATEASIWSILYEIDEVDPEWKSIPYGQAMRNQTVHVLDANLEPRPVWVPGDLYIGGIGLAHGYWRDEAKTRASFITHPLSGERLYRTGDLGRLLPDGHVEFLGREDAQVKIQGHRIELGEIEATLAQHPGIRAAAVAAVGPPRGNKRLIGYVVARNGTLAAHRNGDPPSPITSEPADLTQLSDDPLERLRFKLTQPGMRRDLDTPAVPLIELGLTQRDLEAAYVERRSYRSFHGERLTPAQLSGWLASLRQWNIPGSPFPKYRYGSAGSLHSVQLYLYIKPEQGEALSGGLYYYQPREHSLIPLSPDLSAITRNLFDANDRPTFDAARFAAFLIADLNISHAFYPEEARRFVTLEAGLMTQLLEMNAPTNGIGLCQIGALNFSSIRHLFAIGESHVLLHCLLGGPVNDYQRTLPALVEEAHDYRALVDMLNNSQPNGAGAAASAPTQDLAAELQSWLQQKLPDYMIPSTILILDALPLSPNGKLDRNALPAPDTVQDAVSSGHVEPRSDLEREIAKLLQEILQTCRIGVHDNFFDMGGNSVHLIQFHNRLERLVNRKIPVADMFRYVTVSSLGEYLTSPPPKKIEDRTEALSAGKQRLDRLFKRSSA